MEITWRVDDGYVNHGPKSTIIDDDSILECDSVEEAMDFIYDAVDESFQEQVSYFFDSEKVKKRVEELFKQEDKL